MAASHSEEASPHTSGSILESFDLRGCYTAVDVSRRGGDIECVHVERELIFGDRRHKGLASLNARVKKTDEGGPDMATLELNPDRACAVLTQLLESHSFVSFTRKYDYLLAANKILFFRSYQVLQEYNHAF